MRFSWTRGRSMMVVTAALMALQGAPALAQFVPYNGNQGYSQYQAYSAQQAQPQYMQAQPQYVASAYQGGSPTLNQPVESIAPGQVQPSMAPHAAPAQTAPMQSYSPAPAAGCNCQTSPASAPMSYESYPSSGGYAASTCGNYNTFDAGCGYNTGTACGTNYLGAGRCRGGRRWFGGLYGLFMERDGNPWKALAFSTAATNPAGYYPTDTEFAINLTDIDNDTFVGAEARFGSTLGGGGCGCSCGPRFAWEVAYWGLDEDETTATFTDLSTDANRLYGMIDYRGLEYNPGSGYRPVNVYYDSGVPPTQPAPGGDVVRLRSLVARNTFSMQNLELNLLRLPICGGGYYSGAAGFGGGGFGFGGRRGCGAGGCGVSGYGGCDGGSCGVGGCATGGCDTCASSCCGTGCGYSPRFSLTSVLGVRYLRVDEDFMFRANFENETDSTFGFLSHNIDVDNHLVGAQFGMNGIYRCGCTGRWALHCNSVVGVYGNHMEVWNRMDSPTDNLRFANGANENFDLRYEDDDIAFVGELRAGASYQYSCRCRLFGGYRMVGMSGVALAFDQIPTSFITPNQVSYVDSDGSIFIHGLQAGVELTY